MNAPFSVAFSPRNNLAGVHDPKKILSEGGHLTKVFFKTEWEADRYASSLQSLFCGTGTFVVINYI